MGTYSRCLYCGLVYLNKRPVWSEIISLYGSMHNDSNVAKTKIEQITNRKSVAAGVVIRDKLRDLYHKYGFRPHSWPLETIQASSMSMLDIGCGIGEKLVRFAKRGWEIWGLDINAIALQAAKQLLPDGEFVLGELTEVDLPTEYFDVIRMDNSLEHIPNLQEVAQRCFEILKPGGRLFIYVPHGESLSLRLMKNYSISSWIPFHLQLFTKRSVTKLLTDAGYSNIEIIGYYPLSWLPLSLMQWRYKENVFLKKHPSWLNAICYPVGWLASKLGLAEELVVIAKKIESI